MFVNSSFFAFMHFFVLMLNEPTFDSDATEDKWQKLSQISWKKTFLSPSITIGSNKLERLAFYSKLYCLRVRLTDIVSNEWAQ
jgi:hypothetical protein